MSEYLEWRQDGGPLVRVHRRVIAGLEHEPDPEFRGILLGSLSADSNEIVVQDFARLDGDARFDPADGSIAGRPRHSLPGIGYFRMARTADLVMSARDRDLLNRDFPGPLHVFGLFHKEGGNVRWAGVYVQPAAGPVITEAPPSPADSAEIPHRVLFREESPDAPPHLPPPQNGSPRSRLAYADTLPPPEPPPPKKRGIIHHEYFWPGLAAAVCFVAFLVTFVLNRDRPPQARLPERAAASTREQAAPKAGDASIPDRTADPEPRASSLPAPPPNGPKVFRDDADRSVESPRPGNKSQVQQEVRTALEQWRDSMMRDDLNAIAAHYAPVVGPYFKQSRASRAQVLDETRRTVSRYGALSTFRLSDITIAALDENHAIANFRKQWNTTRRSFSGEEREQLKLERQNGRWLITSEQELKVYWVRRK